MEPFNTSDSPDFLIDLTLSQSRGELRNDLIESLNTAITAAIEAAQESETANENLELFPPRDAESVAKATRVNAQLDHKIEQHSAANPERQQKVRELAEAPNGDAALRQHQRAANARVNALIAALLQKGVLQITNRVVETADVVE
jgi:hypothetical protein